MDCIGPLAASNLEQLRGYLCFIGTDGLSTDFGPAASDLESAHLNRLAVLNSRETVLVVDASKFATPSLFKIVDWDRISRVVTEVRPHESWTNFFALHGITLVLPEDQQGSGTQINTDEHRLPV
jgi:DeoR/GlpR family transcriptional regulator of sugar metabolism